MQSTPSDDSGGAPVAPRVNPAPFPIDAEPLDLFDQRAVMALLTVREAVQIAEEEDTDNAPS